MFRNHLKIAALILVLTLGMTASASAHGPHGGHNHGGYPSYPSYPTYHDTSHFHYHPGSFQQHGNHFHYIPGHYDLHQTGHYHW
jgi:hypothetical protein